jgi:hypothetical protein
MDKEDRIMWTEFYIDEAIAVMKKKFPQEKSNERDLVLKLVHCMTLIEIDGRLASLENQLDRIADHFDFLNEAGVRVVK